MQVGELEGRQHGGLEREFGNLACLRVGQKIFLPVSMVFIVIFVGPVEYFLKLVETRNTAEAESYCFKGLGVVQELHGGVAAGEAVQALEPVGHGRRRNGHESFIYRMNHVDETEIRAHAQSLGYGDRRSA